MTNAPTSPFLKHKSKKGTIAFDFDGVIHKYSRGWQDGSIYDEMNLSVVQYIHELIKQGFSVFIFSSRSSSQIKKWMERNAFPYFGEMAYDLTSGYRIKKIPFWKKFAPSGYLGITNKKLPALMYIDDRAYLFNGNIEKMKLDISA